MSLTRNELLAKLVDHVLNEKEVIAVHPVHPGASMLVAENALYLVYQLEDRESSGDEHVWTFFCGGHTYYAVDVDLTADGHVRIFVSKNK